MKRYLENSVENMRDIGGYTSGKLAIKSDRIIRSNLPANLSIKDIDYLSDLGISAVIDLRSAEEVRIKPSVFENDKRFKIYHIEIKDGRDIPKSSEDVPKSYMKMLEDTENIKNIFKVLQENDRVLYFCNAGKDRTGVVTALILKTLGVKNKDISNDYILTKKFMHKNLEIYANFNKNVLNVITPKKKYMSDFWKSFREKYGTIKEYLNLIGITNSEIKKMQGKFLE